jgi:hypothetical protein
VVSLQTEKVDVSGFQQLLVEHQSQSHLPQPVHQVSHQMDLETVLLHTFLLFANLDILVMEMEIVSQLPQPLLLL